MDGQLLLLVIPLAVIQVALAVTALVHWAKRKTFRILPRWGWFCVILFVGIVGPVVYLAVGRGDE